MPMCSFRRGQLLKLDRRLLPIIFFLQLSKMDRNTPSPTTLAVILYRLVLAVAVSCIAIVALPAAIVMAVFVVFSFLFQAQGNADGSTRIHFELEVTHRLPPESTRRQERSPSPRRSRRTSPPPRQTRRHSPTRFRRSSTPHPAAPYYVREASPEPPSARMSYPPNLPYLQEPVVHSRTTRFRPIAARIAPATSTDPLPPAHPADSDETLHSRHSWRANDHRRPSTQVENDTDSASELSSQQASHAAASTQLPTSEAEAEDEPPPRYERPPEYDDARHDSP